MVKCIIDVAMDVQGEVLTREIKSSLQTKNLKEVPAPYGIAQHPQRPVKLDVAILKQLNGNHTVIKIINLGEKVKIGRARELCDGKAHMVDWKGDVKSMKRMPTFHVRTAWGFPASPTHFQIQSTAGRKSSLRSPSGIFLRMACLHKYMNVGPSHYSTSTFASFEHSLHFSCPSPNLNVQMFFLSCVTFYF